MRNRLRCRADFTTIAPQKLYVGTDAICDESGNIKNDIPEMHWKVAFLPAATGTKVEAEITFASELTLKKLLKWA